MKNKRHLKIMELIDSFSVTTQDELMNMLKSAGFNVTQATVSRDIKELQLIKILGSDGNYKYSRHKASANSDVSNKFYSIFPVHYFRCFFGEY